MAARRWMTLLLSAAVLTACGTDAGTEGSAGSSGGDSAGMAACSRFRDLAADAFAEVLSERAVVSGLQEVSDLASDSTTPAIQDNGVAVGEEANATALINGDPNPAQDALADACNQTFPI